MGGFELCQSVSCVIQVNRQNESPFLYSLGTHPLMNVDCCEYSRYGAWILCAYHSKNDAPKNMPGATLGCEDGVHSGSEILCILMHPLRPVSMS